MKKSISTIIITLALALVVGAQQTQSTARYFAVMVGNDATIGGVRADIYELKGFNLKSLSGGTLGRAVNWRSHPGERLKNGDEQQGMRYALSACADSSGKGRPIAYDSMFFLAGHGTWKNGVFYTVVGRLTSNDISKPKSGDAHH
jgi:hypothetical protein